MLKEFLNTDNAQPRKTVQNDINTDKGDSYYFGLVDENTGFKYNIPLLDASAPGYYFKYVYYMRLKERSENTFSQLMGWN